MPSSGGRDNGKYGEDAAVFQEATPAARELLERVTTLFDETKAAVEDLKNAITTLQQAPPPQIVESKRAGHGPILYTSSDQLLADIDKVLLETPLWADLPAIETVCGGLAGMKSSGMAKSTLRALLIKFELMPEGMTLKRWLLNRKMHLDEQRGQPRLFSHLAAAFIVIAGCLGKFDPSNIKRILLLE